ncbi:aminotransferase class I/II-fold pyridoxal phosphate-dependent enzyme [Rhodobacter calidifons]|uniref:Pyridoxal phosphate-dependent aminotransferase family protein n=1 Tax=Rhodobacter calidifons TaxID=2715277 RepID=A0ABX0G3B5_9RHOB|nr:aminotransferase class I/II-fold pyridoxal phosphate-dependent enzyme [Rhodobacter calidifons]NHB75701.1 pyridoxal phosphate-dependent aminotransferase family protein [Rhodobacter calidifons]
MPRPASATPFPAGTAEAESLLRLLDGGLLRDRSEISRFQQEPRLDFATRDPLALRLRSGPGCALAEPCGDPAQALATRIADALSLAGAATFASAADASRIALAGVMGPGDEALVDSGVDSALFETVRATGARPQRFPAASLDGAERRLRRLCRQPTMGRVLIVAPAVSAHGARLTDLSALGQLARQHGAVLVVDLSQDFGLMGPDGGGVMEIQSCLGRADLVLGDLAPAFGTTGGFAAWRDPDPEERLRRQRPVSAFLPTDRAAAALAAAEMVFGPEGRRRRRKLQGLALRLRNHLMADGLRVPGSAAPFVPVLLPFLTALPRAALLQSAGPRVGLLLAPQVPLHVPRWRIELSARHGLADIDNLADLIRDVSRAFDRVPARSRGHAWGLTEAVT